MEQGLEIVGNTMNNLVDNPKTNTEIVVISANDIKNLSSEELNDLYKKVQAEGDLN